MTGTGTYYEIRVQGHLDGHWAAWFSGMTLARHRDGSTTILGPVTDQAELHGILARVRDLGVDLVSVTAVPGPGRSGEGLGATEGPGRPGRCPLT